MTIQIQNVDESILKPILVQLLQERKDLFKEILREILIEDKEILSTKTDVKVSSKRMALVDEIMEENAELLTMLSQ